MKHLTRTILEIVKTQPAHKLPIIFTREKCPLPDCSESPEDVLKEVLALHKGGWIEAHIIRDVSGIPCRAEIRYITLSGRNLLDGSKTKSRESLHLGKLLLGGIVGAMILLIIFIGSITGRLGFHSQHRNDTLENGAPKSSLLPEPSATPIPIPTPVPLPSPSPESIPVLAAIPVLSPSNTPSPTPSPVPSLKSDDIAPKQRSFKKSW